MKRKDVIKAFKNLGIRLEKLDEHFYHFKYDEVSYLYTYYASDEYFLHISIPSIFEVTDDNIDLLLPVINQANNLIKYVKIHHEGGSLWASIEYPMMEWVKLEEVIVLAAMALQNAAIYFNKLVRGEYEDSNEEDD